MFTKADILVIQGRIRAAVPALVAWAKRRARERSTWKGIALLLAALGMHELSGEVDRVADALTVIGIVSGAGMVAATTSQHPPAATPATNDEGN